MLAHSSGVMGFPLRLLAREIYDRAAAIGGESAGSLLTGEEQLGSETARYVIATVEAMPIHRQFAFLAVDEIQLCADRERGRAVLRGGVVIRARGLLRGLVEFFADVSVARGAGIEPCAATSQAGLRAAAAEEAEHREAAAVRVRGGGKMQSPAKTGP